jgi:hypothetical protein
MKVSETSIWTEALIEQKKRKTVASQTTINAQ